MSDAKLNTKNGQTSQNTPISKPPLAINLADKASDLEDDLDALKLKQANKDARSLTNTSPVPENRSKSPERSTLKQPVPDTTPKKAETKSRTMPAKSIAALSGGPLANYDPYEDVKNGKSEEEVVAKLKNENLKLRKELKNISEELTVLVDKKRQEKKEDVHPPHARDYIAGTATSEKGLQSELETAQKQLARLQKEVTLLGNKYEAHGTYEKIQGRQAHLYDIENRTQELLNQKRQLDKAFREKERALDSLLSQSDYNVQVASMDEDARLNRERVRESDKKKMRLEEQAQKRKEYTQKLIADLESLKQDFKKAQEKTGFEPKEIKPKTEPSPLLAKNVSGDINSKGSKKVPMFKQVEEELACTEENFEKLKKEFKILQKAEGLKGKKNEREVGSYQSQIATLEKNMEDAGVKINERKKEIDILNTKLKDLSRIVRHHAVVPLQEELVVREIPDSVMKRIPSPNRSPANRSPPSRNRSSSKGKKEVKKPHSMLVEYAAKHNFQSKGFRKDEKGKPLREEEGVNFNDRDLVGKQKVKIIALDIWYDDHSITGIQSIYENEKKDVIEGRKHVLNEEKSKKATFETLEEDYLKEISGFINRSETVIECLILRTFRGETMRVGTPGRDSKLFKFDINELEYPSILFGSLKDEKNNSSKLARLGVLISTQSIEEKIDAKENKDEKDASPTGEKDLNKSEDQKDNKENPAIVEEEIENAITEREANKEEHDRSQSDVRKSERNDKDEDRPIEENIAGMESKRSQQGDPSPRKEI